MKAFQTEYKALTAVGKLAVWASAATILTLFATLAPETPRPSPGHPSVTHTVAKDPTPDSGAPASVATAPTATGVNRNSGTIRGNINTVIQTGSGSITIGSAPPEPLVPEYPEPTAAEMETALLQHLKRYGLAERPEGTLFLQLMQLGLTFELQDFDKLACIPAKPASGYNCDYQYIAQGVLQSATDNPANRKSLDELNRLMKLLPGGRENAIRHARFVKAEQRWVLIVDGH